MIGLPLNCEQIERRSSPSKTEFIRGKGAYGPPELEKKDLFMLPCQPVDLKLFISQPAPL